MSRTTVLAVLLVTLIATPAAGQNDDKLYPEIARRDTLIAEQENLLNVYRCRFGVDTQVVPGGCSGGAPTRPPASPSAFSGTPTRQSLRVRDDLIAAQEELLNTYRCMFNIDTQIVPGGCGIRVASYGYWRLVEDERTVGYALSSDTRYGVVAALHIFCYFVSQEQSFQVTRLFVPGVRGLDGTVSFDHAEGSVLVQEWVVLEAPEHTMLVSGGEDMTELNEYMTRRKVGRTSVRLEGERGMRALFWIDGATEAIAAIERIC